MGKGKLKDQNSFSGFLKDNSKRLVSNTLRRFGPQRMIKFLSVSEMRVLGGLKFQKESPILTHKLVKEDIFG